MNKNPIHIMKNRLMILFSLIFILSSCASKLTYSEIEDKVNAGYIAFNENDIDYERENTPIKYIKEYGEKGFEKKLQEVYELRKNNKYPPVFETIGELRIQDLNKCNSTYFYKIKYLVDKTQMTPYLDSTALELNYKSYGRENVNFNTNSKILEVRLKKERILVLDKDRKWKILDFKPSEMEHLDRYFGDGFSKCVELKVKDSEYIHYN